MPHVVIEIPAHSAPMIIREFENDCPKWSQVLMPGETDLVGMGSVYEIYSAVPVHRGTYYDRTQHPCGAREAAFASHWEKENHPSSGANCGRGVLEWLLGRLDQPRVVTQEEATAAASAIQWLGTNCGWCFLEEVLKDVGYEIRRR